MLGFLRKKKRPTPKHANENSAFQLEVVDLERQLRFQEYTEQIARSQEPRRSFEVVAPKLKSAATPTLR